MDANFKTLPIILIVDDTADFLSLIAEDIRDAGYQVLTANSGNQALNIYIDAQKEHPKIDAILSDVQMPDGDGIHLLRTIRKLNQRIPIFLMTGGFSIDEIEAKKLGANNLFMKPDLGKNIKGALKEALAKTNAA